MEGVGEPVTEHTVNQWFFPKLDSRPQMNQMRSLQTRNTDALSVVVTSPLLRLPLKTVQWFLSLHQVPLVILLLRSSPSSSSPRAQGLKTPRINRLLHPTCPWKPTCNSLPYAFAAFHQTNLCILSYFFKKLIYSLQSNQRSVTRRADQ